MKRGDVIMVTVSDGDFFDAGDRARLMKQDEEEPSCWWADFNGLGNLEVTGNGKWCLGDTEFELAFDEDPEEILP